MEIRIAGKPTRISCGVRLSHSLKRTQNNVDDVHDDEAVEVAKEVLSFLGVVRFKMVLMFCTLEGNEIRI